MIHAKNCAKDKVKEANWQNCLPKTDEMEPEWDATEDGVALDGTDNLLGSRLWLLDRKEWGFHSIEHARVDKIRRNGGDMNIGFHFLQFDTHGVAPTDCCPFAGTIDRHSWIAQHASS